LEKRADELGIEKPSVEEMEVDQVPARVIQPFNFTINDGGFTELHSIWAAEDQFVRDNQMDNAIWNRRHDYWLLYGSAV
jgi:hypothetical protein